MQPKTDDLRSVLATATWRDNVALAQLLGLCPLLAITTSVVNGLALGLATMAVLAVSNTTMSLLRGVLVPGARVPLLLLIVAALVTCVDLLTNALLDDLHTALGLFLPLIVVNCAILAQAEGVASRRGPFHSLLAGLASGFGFLCALVVLGALRELLGRGTLLDGLPMLGGDNVAWLRLDLPFDGMLVAVLPPGAFFTVALLLALRNVRGRDAAVPHEGAEPSEHQR
jgi:H+/Na+-translocating ferredoxin:NAD+ oxidoreductase subunit E